MMNFNDMFDVTDKVVLITGGAGGIGRGIAGAFVAGGARVVSMHRCSNADLNCRRLKNCIVARPFRLLTQRIFRLRKLRQRFWLKQICSDAGTNTCAATSYALRHVRAFEDFIGGSRNKTTV